jgi:hypothetical protein
MRVEQTGQRGQMSMKSCCSSVGRGQTFLATLSAAETASRPRATMTPAETTLAPAAAAETATGARTDSQARSATMPVRRAIAWDPGVATVPKAGMKVLKSDRASRHAASGIPTDMGNRRGALCELRTGDDRRAGACYLTHRNSLAHAYAATEASGTANGGASHDRGSAAAEAMNLMTAARSAATTGNDAGRAAGGVKHAARTATRSSAPAMTVPARAHAALTQTGATIRTGVQHSSTLAQAGVHRSGHMPDALVGFGDVILGIVTVGDWQSLVLPAGREVVSRDDAGQDVWAQKSIRAGLTRRSQNQPKAGRQCYCERHPSPFSRSHSLSLISLP